MTCIYQDPLLTTVLKNLGLRQLGSELRVIRKHGASHSKVELTHG
jgi:hypothetical protein